MSSTLLTHCDVGVAACAPPGASRHPRLVLATTILASSLAFIDGSVVNVGLPAIARGLNADAADLQWAINAYLLPLSALLLLGGAVGDRFGRRRILIGGIAIFALATTLCAAAPSLTFLLVGRALQGVGAALLLPTSLAILGGAFSGKGRGGAIGTWAAAGAAAGAIGPVIGGWLIDTVGWRAIFLLNLPVAVAAIGLAWGFVQNDTSDEAAPLDVVGGALATLGLGGLTWGLTIGAGPGGWTPWALVLLAGGAVLIAAFGAVEHGLGDRAMAPLAMFGSPTFVGLTLLTLQLYGALGGLLVLVPYELIEAAGYSATRAGAALLPFPLVMAIASPASGALAGRIGSRAPPVVGSVLVAAGLFLMLRVGAHTDYWTTVLPPILIIALGMAGAAAPLTTAVLNSVDARHTGSASGFNSAAARTGGLIATALLGTVLAAQGPGLTAEFHAAAVVGALSCLAAAACGLALIGKSA
jgi:EmrB/QacA subfamily drug resistance transporter